MRSIAGPVTRPWESEPLGRATAHQEARTQAGVPPVQGPALVGHFSRVCTATGFPLAVLGHRSRHPTATRGREGLAEFILEGRGTDGGAVAGSWTCVRPRSTGPHCAAGPTGSGGTDCPTPTRTVRVLASDVPDDG